MKTKQCYKCQEVKPLSEFHKNKTRKGGHAGSCKGCKKEMQAAWYQKNKKRHMANVRERKLEVIREHYQKIESMNLSCVDCGEDDYLVLDFDHDDPTAKTNSVSHMINNGYAWETIQSEIDLCTIRCANCHRKRTAVQLGWYTRFDP